MSETAISKMKSNYFYLAALLFFTGYIYLTVTGNVSLSGWLLTGFFLSLSFAFRRSSLLKGFSFTLVIFSAVSLAMYYPGYFVQVGSLKLSSLILPLLQIIMFGMGTELSIKEFLTVLKNPEVF
jgi:BASS family bile acid:Na+ symporter